jgi:hypothetical protein
MDPSEMKLVEQVHRHTLLGLIPTARQAELIRLGKQTYFMNWKHSHCTPNQAGPSVFPGCLFLLASRRPILLRNRSNFLGVKCVSTQKRLFLLNKRLLRQILSTNENTCTWFDILTDKKNVRCNAFSSGRLGLQWE